MPSRPVESSRPLILVVEDDPGVREPLEKFLAMHGFDIVAAGSVEAAQERLRERRIQGAGLDVFEQEPIDPADPLLQLDNVIVAPHALCWTDECFRNNGHSACTAILDVAAGRLPRTAIVNRDVEDHPRLLEKLRRFSAGEPGA